MALAAKFRAAAEKAFKIAADVTSTVSYVHVVPGVYDPETGTTVDAETTHSVKALLTGLSDREMDWFPGDLNMQKAIVPHSELWIDTSSQSYFLIDGVRWEIKRIDTVPTHAIRKFYIRKP